MAFAVNKKRFLIALLAGLVVLLGAGFWSEGDSVAQAQVAGEMHGWAWSSNIGWVSFNSTDPSANSAIPYNVSLNDSQQLTGYAWSSNIGWIRFDPSPSYTGVAGQGDNYGAKITGTTLTGWARACAVFVSGCSGDLRASTQNGGWDGWVKMTDVSYDSTTGGLSGFSWGDLNLGWLSLGIFGSSSGGECDPLVQVCTGPGGGNISCTVDRTTGDTNTPFTFTTIGGGASSVYNWTSDNGFGTYQPQPPVVSSFQTIFPTAGTYHLAVSVGGSVPAPCNVAGVTVDPACIPDGDPVDPVIACCNNDPSDATDGICGPPSTCEISFDGSNNAIYYYNKVIQPLGAPKVKISISACTGQNLNLSTTNIDPHFGIVCAPANLSTSFGSCSGLSAGQSYWVGVEPTGSLPSNSITQLFSLSLDYTSDGIPQPTKSLWALFKYIVSGIN